jgi:hypothetical protein
MIAALVTTGAHFDPGGQPVSTADLFDYDVSRGGQRFLINTGVKHAAMERGPKTKSFSSRSRRAIRSTSRANALGRALVPTHGARAVYPARGALPPSRLRLAAQVFLRALVWCPLRSLLFQVCLNPQQPRKNSELSSSPLLRSHTVK